MNHVLFSKTPCYLENAGVTKNEWRGVVARFMSAGTEVEVDANAVISDDRLLLLTEGVVLATWEFDSGCEIPLGITSDPVILHPVGNGTSGITFKSFGGRAKLISIAFDEILNDFPLVDMVTQVIVSHLKDKYIVRASESEKSRAERKVMDILEILHHAFVDNGEAHVNFRKSDLMDVAGISRRHGARIISAFMDKGLLKRNGSTHGWILESRN